MSLSRIGDWLGNLPGYWLYVAYGLPVVIWACYRSYKYKVTARHLALEPNDDQAVLHLRHPFKYLRIKHPYLRRLHEKYGLEIFLLVSWPVWLIPSVYIFSIVIYVIANSIYERLASL